MKLRAWLETKADGVKASFHGAGTNRPPATRTFPTSEEARRWVENEAAILRTPIEWARPPQEEQERLSHD